MIRAALSSLLQLMRPGDWLILAAGILGGTYLFARLPAAAERVTIQQGGRVVLEVSPRLDREVWVAGPLGDTVVEIRAGRVRVKSDPSPRQRCVRQGWLAPGETALCLPNQVSVALGTSRHDTLSY